MTRRNAILFWVLAIAILLLFAIDMGVGSVDITASDIWAALTGGDGDPIKRKIIIDIRLTKALVAILAGAGLAVSGLQMQTLFRNPLAGPYVLGVSSGASLGVALFLSTIIVTSFKVRKARRTQYVVTRNVIQYQENNTPNLKFVLESGATVESKQSFKGFIFGYGTLTISQGTGYAGKCKISRVKSVRKAKRLLQAQIKRYGKFVKTV